MSERIQVLKVGGAHLDDPGFLDQLLERVRALAQRGPVVLVHGGGKQIGALQAKLDLPTRTEGGLRVTTRDGMDVVAMVLGGLVNKRVVAHFGHAGLTALGVSGADAGLMRAPIHGRGELGRVGGAPTVELPMLHALLRACPVLVVAPVCQGPDGGLLNVNADTAAQALAVAVEAEGLEFVTDVDAVRSAEGPETELTPTDVQRLIRHEVVQGGMLPKMRAALAALEAGVGSVRVGSLRSLQAGGATEVRA